jgi:hypothetical protein
MYRIAALICSAIAVGLTVVGIVLAIRSGSEVAVSEESAFVIDNPDRDLGFVPAGIIEVAFDLTNPAGRPRRIIGFAEG